MIPITNEDKSYHKQKVCHTCKKGFSTNDKTKKYNKVKDYCHYTEKYRGAAHNICKLRYKILKYIPVVFLNGSAYDYHNQRACKKMLMSICMFRRKHRKIFFSTN